MVRLFKMTAFILGLVLLYKDAIDFSFKNPTIETTSTNKMSDDLIPDIYICKDFTEREATLLLNESIYGMERLIFGFGDYETNFFNNYTHFFSLSGWNILGTVAIFRNSWLSFYEETQELVNIATCSSKTLLLCIMGNFTANWNRKLK